jgi:hypothetical protein
MISRSRSHRVPGSADSRIFRCESPAASARQASDSRWLHNHKAGLGHRAATFEGKAMPMSG